MKIDDPTARLSGELIRSGLDAAVCMSPDNVAYTAGYLVPSQALGIRQRLIFCILTADGRSRMIVSSSEYTYAQEKSRIGIIRPYDLTKNSPIQVLAEQLDELGLGQARIGLETDFFPVKYYGELRRRLPCARFVSGQLALSRARMLKTASEIMQLRQAAQIADKARCSGCSHAFAGTTERDLHRLIVDAALHNGADGIGPCQVASGVRSYLGNPSPENKILDKGDLVKIDLFVHKNGYWSDTGKAAVVEEPSSFQLSIWEKLVHAQSHLVEQIAPGVNTKELWFSFIQSFRQLGLEPALSFLGHGIGLSLHEMPYIDENTDVILEPGMVLCIEPVYKVPGQMGFHIEDEVLVTASGRELLTDLEGARNLTVIGGAAHRSH